MTSSLQTPCIWLFQDGEPLPVGSGEGRLLRTGILAEKLAASGVEVHWFASRFIHATKSLLPNEAFPIRMLDNYYIYPLRGRSYRSNISLHRIAHQAAIAKHFKKISDGLKKPDIILASYPSPELCQAATKYAIANNIPFVVDIRDPWPEMFAEYFPWGTRWLLSPLIRYYRSILRSCLQSASGICSMSESMLRFSVDLARVPDSKSHRVFYLGYKARGDLETKKLPERFSDHTPLVCTYIGMFGKSYDLSLVIHAASRVYQKVGDAVRFHLIGDGETRGQLEELVSKLPCNVHFLGWMNGEDASQELSASHIGIIPIQGGVKRWWFGNKIFEYMAHSMAIVSNVPGDADKLISTHKIGESFLDSTPEELSLCILDYYHSAQKLEQQRRNAQSVFEAQYDTEKIYQDYIDYILSFADSSAMDKISTTARA